MVELAFILLATVVSWPPALTKKCCMSEPFPTGLPRADKITPKSVRTLHEGSREKVSKYFTALYLLYSISCLQLRTLAGRHVVGVFVVEDLGSFILFFAHALSFNRLLIASLAPLIAVVEAFSSSIARNLGHGKSVQRVWSAKPIGIALLLAARTEALPIYFDGHHLGSVDCWLCQIFIKPLGTTLPSFRGLLRVEAWVFSSWRLYVAEVFLTVTSTTARCGPAFGELSGGNWIGRSHFYSY